MTWAKLRKLWFKKDASICPCVLGAEMLMLLGTTTLAQFTIPLTIT